MRRHRAIAGPPVRSSSEAWSTTEQLLVATLRPGQTGTPGTRAVAAALAPLAAIAPALVAAGHLREPLVLRGGPLDLAVTVLLAEQAFELEENLNPVPGGADVGDEWVLHLPSAGALDGALRAAVTGSTHLSCAPPPSSTAAGSVARSGVGVQADGGLVDLAALDALGGSS